MNNKKMLKYAFGNFDWDEDKHIFQPNQLISRHHPDFAMPNTNVFIKEFKTEMEAEQFAADNNFLSWCDLSMWKQGIVA